jgi:hypothetical protein
MLLYFRGLAAQCGKNYGFNPDMKRIAARYTNGRPESQTFGGEEAKSFNGTVTIYDTHGKLITLNSEVVVAVCPGTSHTALFFGMSSEQRSEPVWKAAGWRARFV